jgi:hypothetical protein
MWMVAQKAILTKDNMIAGDWHGDPGCYFCGRLETVDHLFSCPIAKVVWGLIAICFNQNTRNGSYEVFWLCVLKALHRGDKVYMLGLVAVCWVIWLARNKICFENKSIKNPGEVFFFCLWANAILIWFISRRCSGGHRDRGLGDDQHNSPDSGEEAEGAWR